MTAPAQTTEGLALATALEPQMPSQSSTSMSLTGLRDNHSRGKAGEFLMEKITPGSALSFVSAYFTVHAYQAMRDELEAASGLRFLFGEPSFIRSIEKEGKQSRQFTLGDQGLALANQLSQKKFAKDCAKWIAHQVEIRSIVRKGFLHGKMYHIQDGKVESALLGSSNFTVPGLGLQASGNNIELNLVVNDDRDRKDLLVWFNGLWNDNSLTSDVKDQVRHRYERLGARDRPTGLRPLRPDAGGSRHRGGHRQMTILNPNRIPSSSPGLRGTSYPGFPVAGIPNPNGVVSSRAASPMAATPLGLMEIAIHIPRVARASQPWAGSRSPVGTEMRDFLTHFHQPLNAPCHPIRNRLLRLLRLTANSPDLLAIIKQEGKV